MTLTSVLRGIVLCTIVAVAPAYAATSEQGILHGTVRLHGGSISADDVVIRLQPLVEPKDLKHLLGDRLEAEDREEGQRPPGARMARVSALPDERSALQFVIPDVVPGIPYRLGIQFHGQSVGKVVWRVTDGGLVKLPLRGVAAPVQVDGYVVTSEIEIRRPTARGRNAHQWVGADNLDFNDPSAAVRTFRWRTSLPDVSMARLQISTRPLTVPAGGTPPNPCDTTGLIFSVDFDVQPSQWTALPAVDFHSIVFGARSGEVALPGVDPRTLRGLQAGGGLYVRAVPLGADGAPRCNPDQSGVVGMAIVGSAVQAAQRAAELAEAPITLSEATYQPPQVSVHPKSDEVCYRTKTDNHFLDPSKVDLLGGPGQFGFNPNYDVFDHYLMTSGKVPKGTIAPIGAFFCVYNPPKDSSWLDDFTGSIFDLVTGFVDAVAEIVNFASKLLDEVKGVVVEGAAAGLAAVGVDCDDTCHAALEAGLEAGMVAMGVPPSLPNFNDLMEKGTDYLADMAADELGVPPEVTEKLASEGATFIKGAAKDMAAQMTHPGLPDWLTPDVGLSPAVLTLYLSGPGYALSTQPGLARDYDPIFLGSGLVKLPRQFGSTPGVKLPMLLQPNLDGLPTVAPTCVPTLSGQQVCFPPNDYQIALANKQHWVSQKLNNGCARFYAIMLTPAPSLIYKLFSAFVEADMAPIPFWDGFASCTP